VSNQLTKLATVFCVLVSLWAGGASAESSWQRFAATIPGGGSFSIEFPHAPKYQTMQDAVGNIRYNAHIWSVELDYDRAYIVSVAVFPFDAGAPKARRILEGGLKAGAARTSSGQWESVEWKQHQGLPAFDAVGKTRSGRDMRVYSVMKATQVFALTCTGLPGSARSGDADRFIASLKIQ
jgi:hypothetical protein